MRFFSHPHYDCLIIIIRLNLVPMLLTNKLKCIFLFYDDITYSYIKIYMRLNQLPQNICELFISFLYIQCLMLRKIVKSAFGRGT